MWQTKADVARWVDEGPGNRPADRAGYRANVILNVERSLMIARPLLALELDDELTPAPVFRP
jgi:hypothetical protein